MHIVPDDAPGRGRRICGAEGEQQKLSGKRIGHGRDSGKERGLPLYADGATAKCGNLSGSLRRRKVRAYFAFFHFFAAGPHQFIF